MRPTISSVLLISSAALACGCGGVDLPDRATVHGSITLDNQPVTTGEITFMPDESKGTIGPSATGTIDASGNYTLTTDHQGDGGDGAIAGFHRVRIVAREPAEPGAPSKSLIPQRYADFKTSGLTAEVKLGESNKLDWPLTTR
jgi:hypothetical protein